VHNGDKIKLRDAVGNFIKSPAVQVRWYLLICVKLGHDGLLDEQLSVFRN
jgi:hypothetical protein